jgi:hypothetical protein
MTIFHWAKIGLALDMCGAFLLSAEAIKIHNLNKLRDRILQSVFEKICMKTSYAKALREELGYYRKYTAFLPWYMVGPLHAFLGRPFF